jgi:hypothetical protein
MLSIAQKWDKIVEKLQNFIESKIMHIEKMCKDIYATS